MLRGLPSRPLLLGLAALAVAAGGALTTADGLVSGSQAASGLHQAAPSDPAVAGTVAGAGTTPGAAARLTAERRRFTISRDSRRDVLADEAANRLVERAEVKAAKRATALEELARKAQGRAAVIEKLWSLPIADGAYRLTARFGQYGLWASYHTGLDFAAPTGTPIRAVAGGVVTSTAYDGAYGNKTVVTLDDGTELWYCHQDSFGVSTGESVRAGDTLGYVGSTGNVTGPHLHLEVRPGDGEPVDPYSALVEHGLTP